VKVCELCVGVGCGPGCLICPVCFGTGMICLGHESADRYEQMKEAARAKAARLGWTEEVWVGEWPHTKPRLVRRVIVHPSVAHRKAG
jgi:hypothetical protein